MSDVRDVSQVVEGALPTSKTGTSPTAQSTNEPISIDPAQSHVMETQITTEESKLSEREAILQNLQERRALLASLFKPGREPNGDPSAGKDDNDELAIIATVEAARNEIKRRIAQLQRYNEIKDVGQTLMGLMADHRGVRITEVMADLGLEERD